MFDTLWRKGGKEGRREGGREREREREREEIYVNNNVRITDKA